LADRGKRDDFMDEKLRLPDLLAAHVLEASVSVLPINTIAVAQRRFKENRPFDLVEITKIIEKARVIERGMDV
jgi:hypothetical protein